MSNDPKKIALFIDFENLETGVRKQYETRVNIEPLIDDLSSMGKIIVRRAYGDWVQHANYRHVLLQCGVELMERPNISPGKNGADIKLTVDAIETALQSPSIGTFVIVSGNSDFLPLLQKLRAYDKRVVVVGVQACTSNLLRKNCDRYLAYENLSKSRPSKPESSGASGIKVPDSLLKVIEKAFKAKNGKADSNALRGQVRQLDGDFNERSCGANTFNDLLQFIERKDLLPIKQEGRNAWSMRLPEEPKPQWEDREMTEEEWESMIEAVRACIAEGEGRPNQGKLWIINAYLHRKRLDGILPLENHILADGLQALAKEGILVQPSHDTYLLGENFEEKREEFLDEMFGVEIEEEVEEKEAEAETPAE